MLLLVILLMLGHILSTGAIYYPEYFMSNYCGDQVGKIIMGHTPYFRHSLKRFTDDSASVAAVKAAEKSDLDEVVRNCSIIFTPPPGQAILINPRKADNGNDIGAIAIYVDHRLIWFWDEEREFNRSLHLRAASAINGTVKIKLLVDSITTTWKHFKLEIFLTAFTPLSLSNKDICDTAFHFNCGNSRCIRQVLMCDGRDNCGNYEDEAFCGLDTLSASLLFSSLAISLIFMLSIFWLDSHPKFVQRIRCSGLTWRWSKSFQLN